jgi:hypothetical protein
MFLRFMDGLHHWKFHFPFTFFRKAFFLMRKTLTSHRHIKLVFFLVNYYVPSCLKPLKAWLWSTHAQLTICQFSRKWSYCISSDFYWPFCISVQSSMYDSIVFWVSLDFSFVHDHYLKNSFFMTSNGTWIRKLTPLAVTGKEPSAYRFNCS